MTYNRYDLKTDLEEWLKNSKKVVIAGIGNPIRSDDLVGVKIVQELKNKVSKEVELFECETVPESFIEPITKLNPTHVLLIDAAFFSDDQLSLFSLCHFLRSLIWLSVRTKLPALRPSSIIFCNSSSSSV